jgi:protein ImuB
MQLSANESVPAYSRNGKAESTHAFMRASPARPNWLLATPQPVVEGSLQLLSGPERIESGWWDGGDCRRDYFIAEDRHGRRVWVFQTLGKSPAWYLHGVFG